MPAVLKESIQVEKLGKMGEKEIQCLKLKDNEWKTRSKGKQSDGIREKVQSIAKLYFVQSLMEGWRPT